MGHPSTEATTVATRAKATRNNPAPSLPRLVADADKAAALAEVAKRQVRAAKAELKKARKLSKTAKKTAKQARKKIATAMAAVRNDASAAALQKAPTQHAVKAAGAPRKPARKTFKSAADVAKSVIGRLSAAKAAKRSAAAPDADGSAGDGVREQGGDQNHQK